MPEIEIVVDDIELAQLEAEARKHRKTKEELAKEFTAKGLNKQFKEKKSPLKLPEIH